MEEQAKRSPGGKLALWALYAFCGYCVWVIVRYWWVVGKNSQRSRRQRGG